ncbi:DEAD/DEAH box helicase [Enterococcus avium]|uniref:DEAD/DEAH box helicase n=1 Tax=Enterococcus avium TaxID=33945 RepID=A0AAW8RPF6_ENTAV|nr:DEAD/DEAH box helicase [Enterococcus avium]MDT2388290.1 DEAD/DEAH box helicase [Enterococcus avium]MDT2401446.1 DEAD/DEAH box helicase [Enterococcus avium]MDT2435330.1 DEAD/DEAH box helicase [Enterococcus avium]
MVFDLYGHQKELKRNIYRLLSKGTKNVLAVSPAGSGKSIVIASIMKDGTDHKKQFLFMVHRKELIDQIEETLKQNDVDLKFVTNMSVMKVKNRLDLIPKPDLIITDETHHSKAKTYMEIYNHFEDVPRIGFTATPVRLSGEGFADVYQKLVEGKSVSWLIKNDFLAPFRYFSIPLIDRKTLKKRSGEFTTKSISEALKNENIFADVVSSYQAKADGNQAILYAHNIQYSKKFAESFCAAGIPAIHVDSKTLKKEREKIMNGFKNKEFKVICNVDLISEGFNVPDCSTVILLRPTQSLTIFIQQSMRGMRYVPGKTSIIIDHVGNYLKHGLPDMDRTWSLELGIIPPEKEKKLIECPKCSGIFSKWINKENKKYEVKICPICSEEFWKEKTLNKTENKSNLELEEINKQKKLINDLKNVGKQRHLEYKESLLSIAKIFVSRNVVAEFENRKKPYNYPIHYAIREFLENNDLSNVDWKKVYEELEVIEEAFGNSYNVEAVGLMKYIKKVEPSIY